ncbi:MAG TPA: methyltransferase [Eubacteriaceae bacterium]|nr:methyltransferase [Eubacteriaceae bacterium]
MEITLLDIIMRIAVSILLSGVIGIEREKTNKPAGLRTHVLLAVGSASVMLTGMMLFYTYGSSEPDRLGAQVISGIGFLGAGTIIRSGFEVKGLTTAASIWAVGCIGLAVGAGYYEIAVTASLAVFLALKIFGYIHLNKTEITKTTHAKILFNRSINVEKIYHQIEQQGFKIIAFQYGERKLEMSIFSNQPKRSFNVFDFFDTEDVETITLENESGV